MGARARVLGLVGGEVDEEHGARPGEEVEGGEDDEQCGADEDGHLVEAEVLPQIVQVAWENLGGHNADQRDQHQVQAVGDHVMVPQFHVLEVHRLLEVRKSPFLRRWGRRRL